MSYILYMLKV